MKSADEDFIIGYAGGLVEQGRPVAEAIQEARACLQEARVTRPKTLAARAVVANALAAEKGEKSEAAGGTG